MSLDQIKEVRARSGVGMDACELTVLERYAAVGAVP